jgi:hypothetical protein
MKPSFRSLLFIAFALLLGSCEKGEESLSLLVWEGYAEPGNLRKDLRRIHSHVLYAP